MIREMRKKWFIVMLRKKVPHRIWDYVLKRVAEIMQRTAGSAVSLHCRTYLEELTGETPDISEYLYFAFHFWCCYNDNSGLEETKLGKWMGVSHRVVSLMYYWVIA